MKTKKDNAAKTAKKRMRSTLQAFASLDKSEKNKFKADELAELLAHKKFYAKKNVFRNYPAHRRDQTAAFLPNLTYGYSVVMRDKIDVEKLTAALYECAVRFPSIRMELKGGFFSFILEENGLVPQLKEADGLICEYMELERMTHLFNLLFSGNRITLEACSLIADYTAIKNFLSCLIGRYIELTGGENKSSFSRFDVPLFRESSSPTYNITDIKNEKIKKIKGIHLKEDEELGITNLISLETDLDKINAAAGSDISAFASKLLAESIADYLKLINLRTPPITIGLITDMRKFYPTQSMRPFSFPIGFEQNDTFYVDKRKADTTLQHYLGKAKKLSALPLFIKKRLPKPKFTALCADAGEWTEKYEQIVRVESVLGGNFSLSFTSYANKLVFTFASKISDSVIEREFARKLTKYSPVFVDTNRRNALL